MSKKLEDVTETWLFCQLISYGPLNKSLQSLAFLICNMEGKEVLQGQ